MNEIPQQLFGLVPLTVELRRDNRVLNDQFSYRFAVSDDGTLGAYMAAFTKTFNVMGLLCFDASMMNDVHDEDVDNALEAVAAEDEAASSISGG